MNAERTYESLFEFYRSEIYKAAMNAGGYTALSKRLGMEESYVCAQLSRGKIDTLRKIYNRIGVL